MDSRLNNHTIMLNYYISSPLEQFEVINLFSFNAPMLNTTLTITNLGFYSLVVVSLLVLYHSLSNNHSRIIPSKWSISTESLYSSLLSLVREQLGNEMYLPFIYSLFTFILIANLVGNVPYSFTIFTSAIVSLGFSFTIWLAVTILSLSIHRIHFFSYFVPAGCPLALVPLLVLIEIISYVARAVSLGLRIFANMLGGHTLLQILSSFLFKLFGTSLLVAIVTLIPFALFLGILLLELASTLR